MWGLKKWGQSSLESLSLSVFLWQQSAWERHKKKEAPLDIFFVFCCSHDAKVVIDDTTGAEIGAAIKNIPEARERRGGRAKRKNKNKMLQK